MISKSQIKLIRQLEQKKYRQREGLFVAEGPKVVGDLLRHGYKPVSIFATEDYSLPLGGQGDSAVNGGIIPLDIVITVTSDELRRISFLQHPQHVLALFRLPNFTVTDTAFGYDGKTMEAPSGTVGEALSSLTLALDGVQDPGNLGTIIRLADWFGIANIVCSLDTADAWNPKVIQATMGSIARVNIYYINLLDFINNSRLPVCGTVLDGDNIYTAQLPAEAILVMGNEGNGISPQVRSLLTHRLLIPPAARANTTDSPESLNVAIATAIACSEFARRNGGISAF